MMLPFIVDPSKDTICAVIKRWADIQPDAPALIAENRSVLSYRALSDVIDRIRADLKTLGLGRDDRIAIVHSGPIDTGILTLAVFGIAAAAPLDPRQTEEEFVKKVAELGAKSVIFGPNVPKPTREKACELGLKIVETRPCRIAGTNGFETWTSLAVEPGAEADQSIPVGPEDIAFVLATSGTTQRSKIVPTKHRRVLAFCEQRHVAYELRPDDICAVARPIFYSAGINSIVMSLYSGGAALVMSEFEPAQFLRRITDQRATWFNGGPAMLKALHGNLLEYPQSARGQKLRLVLQTSGYLEPEIIDYLEKALHTSVRTTYASSETGLIAVGRPGSRVGELVAMSTLTENFYIGESEVSIRSSDGRFSPSGKPGEIVVRGPQVIEAYENAPDLNDQAFVDGWFRTGDEGHFDENGYLHLTGRIKEIINRGGEKVSPTEVDAAILKHPDVIDAATFPLRHPTLGEEVAMAVVPAPGADLTDQILTRYLLPRLSGFKIPRRFYFVSEIPKNPAGKLQRSGLAEELGISNAIGPHAAGGSDREPTPLEAQLRAIWAEVLRIPRVGLDDNFFMIGGDSLQAVDLFHRVEKELGRSLPRSILFEAGTVAKMAQCIEEFTTASCLVPIQPKGDAPPFFCVHDGNGEVLNYRELARLVGETQPFCGIRCRGLDEEGLPFTRIEDMAAHYIDEMKKVQPKGPYYIGGYSFGGRVAYVMAQRLRAAGEEVALLALLDTASGYGQRRVPIRDWLSHHLKRLKATSPSQVPAYLAMRATNFVGMVVMGVRIRCFALAWRYFERTNRTVPRFMRRPVPANDMIRRTYQPRAYNGDATLFKAERFAWTHADSHEGWKELVKGKLEIRPISGRHFEIVQPPHVQCLAAELADALTQAQSAARAKAGSPSEQTRSDLRQGVQAKNSVSISQD